MSYLVLARKHRPQAFKDVIGQDHICHLLAQAISTDRIAHAYLFCGPRGVGKTTCARIFAMCLNCEDGPKAEPDLASTICQEIAKGTSFDVLEIDGASNRGIDEVRALRENVKFAPTVGRYKIYIVDEVHMLTTEAFNALLKTLEEPPEHVKFIFATTEPNKLPATILSRCQRFDFKRIAMNTIVDSLAAIAKKEKLKIDQDALYAIAKAAKGSMRDALSILDQLSALTDEGIDADAVHSMLGIVETQYLFDMVEAVAAHDCTQALESLDQIINQGKDIKQLIRDLIEHFRHLMVIKIGGKSMGKLVDYPIAIKDMLLKQMESFTLSEILNAIELLLEAQNAARVAESYRLALEVCFAQLTFSGQPASETQTPPAIQNRLKDAKAQAPSAPAPKKKDKAPPPAAETVAEEPSAPKTKQSKPSAATLELTQIERAWDALTSAISREKMSLATYLQEGAPVEIEGDTLYVGFPKESVFYKEVLEENENTMLIERVFGEKLNASVLVRFKFVENLTPKVQDASVKSALEEFGGEVTNHWHND